MVSTVSGGFATVQPGSKLSINAVEGYPLEDFSAEVCKTRRKQRGQDVDKLQAVRNQIAEAQKIASGSGSEQDIAEAKIELEVSFSRILFETWPFTKQLQVLESLQGFLK